MFPTTTSSSSSTSSSLVQATVRCVPWSDIGSATALSAVRLAVFCDEQHVDRCIEIDGRDDKCMHWRATVPSGDADDKGDGDGDDSSVVTIGTARFDVEKGKIGRCAVLRAYRGQGVGAAILSAIVADVAAAHPTLDRVILHAQSHSLGFYQRAGFVAEGDEFVEANIKHFKMVRMLK
jgi:predicted GNAT family N-acyltransferase